MTKCIFEAVASEKNGLKMIYGLALVRSTEALYIFSLFLTGVQSSNLL
jgi:hypothetical protein